RWPRSASRSTRSRAISLSDFSAAEASRDASTLTLGRNLHLWAGNFPSRSPRFPPWAEKLRRRASDPGAQPGDVGGLALHPARRLHHDGGSRSPDDGGEGVTVDGAGAEVRMPVRT